MGFTEDVRQFTTACHEGLPNQPTALTPEAIAFIRRMVNDELEELVEAKTVTEQADALVDAIYYLCDCGARHGMNLDPLFAIVHAANMSKVVNGKVIKRADGKVLKPAGWQDPGPKLDAEVARQAQHGAFKA